MAETDVTPVILPSGGDDTDQITTAIASMPAGGTVRLGPGVFIITRKIPDLIGVRPQGAGIDVTEVRYG